jgi:pimeloyl-ACP methyl ester carboxylesterase
VVQWDQRGAGKSTFDENGQPLSKTITYDRMVQDTEEMADYLRRRTSASGSSWRGHSWGSVIGLELARKHPDWLHAYVGIGQVIDMLEGEKVSYEFVLAEAKRRGNKEAIEQLESIAPYPDPKGIKVRSVLIERTWVNAFGGMSYGREGLNYELGARVLSPEWTDADLKADDNGETLTRLMSGPARNEFHPDHETRLPGCHHGRSIRLRRADHRGGEMVQGTHGAGQAFLLVREHSAHGADGAARALRDAHDQRRAATCLPPRGRAPVGGRAMPGPSVGSACLKVSSLQSNADDADDTQMISTYGRLPWPGGHLNYVFL